MSVEIKAFKGASWLALFKLISQVFSWVITILVARILLPDDYGLMEMATIITGYAAIFSELGLGAAIIHRPTPTKEELSSVFWCALAFSALLALGCFGAAYPTAWIFNEPRVIPLTQAVSVLFILSGLQIVPLTLLKKELDFKKVGFIEMMGVFVSCSCMLFIAYLGGGVWTLLGGHIIRNITRVILIYLNAKWFPHFHFDFKEARLYLRFGIIVVTGGSLFYIYTKSDRFFAGRAWAPTLLGYYSLALQLAQIPTEKIVVLINQVSFSAFSKLQDNRDKFNKFYLDIVKVTATLVFPIFTCGYLLGDELVRVLLNEKWFPIIFLFKYLCLAQIMTAINAVNDFVHTAQGRPHWSVWFNTSCALLMPLSFYFAVQQGLHAILLPWFTTYMLICSIWIVLTLHKIGIMVTLYLKNLRNPVVGSLVMVTGIVLVNYLSSPLHLSMLVSLIAKLVVGMLCYIGYLWFFNRDLFFAIVKIKNVQPSLEERMHVTY